MNSSKCIYKSLVYSLLFLIGSQLMTAKTCYNYTGIFPRAKTSSSSSAIKSALCYIEIFSDAKVERGLEEYGTLWTLEPDKFQCYQHHSRVLCFCPTDNCNDKLPYPKPKVLQQPPDDVTCIQEDTDSQKRTCKGYACGAKVNNDKNSSLTRYCYNNNNNIFKGSKKNGCVRQPYLPLVIKKMCYCDTDMCDAFAQSDDDSPSTSQSTLDGQSNKRMFIADGFMVMLFAWMAIE